MKVKVSFEFNRRKWFGRLFPMRCAHTPVSVEENFDSRYGSHTSYMYCLDCGREAMELERTCKHDINSFGKCRNCLARLKKEDCTHQWSKEPDTDDEYCENCGEWKD
jgi:hypothetical protein